MKSPILAYDTEINNLIDDQIINNPIINDSSSELSKKKTDILFQNNGNIYHGNRYVIFNTMIMFNDMNVIIEHDEVIIYYIGRKIISNYNQCIDSCCTKRISMELIPSEDFIHFIKFIDQYLTMYVQIDKIEDHQIH